MAHFYFIEICLNAVAKNTLPSGNFSDWFKETRNENDVCVYSRTTKLSWYNAAWEKVLKRGTMLGCSSVRVVFHWLPHNRHGFSHSLPHLLSYSLLINFTLFNFPTIYTGYSIMYTQRNAKSYSPSALLEDEFLGEIQTKVFRVFLLAIQIYSFPWAAWIGYPFLPKTEDGPRHATWPLNCWVQC